MLLDKSAVPIFSTVECLYLAVVTFGIDNVEVDTLFLVVLVTLHSETLEDEWFVFFHNVTRFTCVALPKMAGNGGYCFWRNGRSGCALAEMPGMPGAAVPDAEQPE